MKALAKEQAAKTLVVNPAARRCGVDEQPEGEGKGEAALGQLVDSLRETREYMAVSDRILNFAQRADREVEQILSAKAQGKIETVELSAQRLANLATELGASPLIRTCYQLLITIRQGHNEKAMTLIDDVNEEYQKLKSGLRLEA